MAQSKDDVKYGAAQAKVSEDEMLRVRYKHGTPIEGGKIAESQPVELFDAARKIQTPTTSNPDMEGQRQGQGRGVSAATTAASTASLIYLGFCWFYFFFEE